MAELAGTPDVLDGPRARGAFLLRVLMEPPWALEIMEDAPLTMVAVLGGDSWLRRSDQPPQRLVAGDVLLVRGAARYLLSDEPTTTPVIRIGPGQSCSGRDGRDLSDELAVGVRAWGNNPAGRDSMLVASYPDDVQLGAALAAALPEFALVGGADSPLLPVLVAEAARLEVGARAALSGRGRHAADRLPRAMAAVAGSRSAARHRPHFGISVARGRLRQRVQLEHCLQEGLRNQSGNIPIR